MFTINFRIKKQYKIKLRSKCCILINISDQILVSVKPVLKLTLISTKLGFHVSNSCNGQTGSYNHVILVKTGKLQKYNMQSTFGKQKINLAKIISQKCRARWVLGKPSRLNLSFLLISSAPPIVCLHLFRVWCKKPGTVFRLRSHQCWAYQNNLLHYLIYNLPANISPKLHYFTFLWYYCIIGLYLSCYPE